MTKEKTSILVPCTVDFKNALLEYCGKHNTDMTKVLREATAALIGYDLNSDNVQLGRRKTYNSVEERLEAQKERARKERQMKRILLEMYEHEAHVRDVIAIRESLEAKGIEVE